MAEAALITDLTPSFRETAVAAFHEYSHNTSLTGQLNLEEARVWDLGGVSVETHLGATVIRYIRAICRLAAILPKYEVVYIFFPGTLSSIAGLLCRIARRRYGLYVRGDWMSGKDEDGLVAGRVLRGADFILATGEGFRRRLALIGKRVENEVPLTPFRPDGNVTHRVFPSRRMRLMFAGRLVESKGVLDLVRAVALLTAQGNADVELMVVGGGLRDEQDAVEALARETGVSDRVKLLGHKAADEMGKCYQDADVFVFPTYYPEGFPRVLYEAMIFGMPIVTTRMPGTIGFLEDARNCLLCPPRSPRDLADVIQRLVSDRPLMERIASYARSDVEQLFRDFKHKSHAEQVLAFIAGE